MSRKQGKSHLTEYNWLSDLTVFKSQNETVQISLMSHAQALVSDSWEETGQPKTADLNCLLVVCLCLL